jgi:hypothetical protein
MDPTHFIQLDSLPTEGFGKTKVKVFYRERKKALIPYGSSEMANSLILNEDVGFRVVKDDKVMS